MVRKENIQASGNSLLMTATSKRFGPGRFASLISRHTSKPPVKKVKYSSSDASRVSEMTASVVEEARPAVIKEVKVVDFDVESSILEMSITSGKSSIFANERNLFGNEKVLTPQPRAYLLPPKKDGKSMEKKEVNMEKREVNMHKGITFKAPSPMSLDRVQVQMGQERTAPPSMEWKKEDAERKKIEDQRREKKEFHKSAKEAARKFNEDMHNEVGEGFETQLDDAEFEPAPTKKSLMKTFLKKIRPKKAMTEDRARGMAREAILKSKSVKSDADGKRPLVPGQLQVIPLEEITMVDHEENISDLDSIGKRNFPVQEVTMAGEDSRDDSSVSTLGTQHILERMGPGPLSSRRFQKDRRDPTPTDDLNAMGRQQMFHPKGTPALIDRIDSGNMTEDVHQRAEGGRQASTTLGMLAAAMCMVPGMGGNSYRSPENKEKDMDDVVVDKALAHIKKGIEDDNDYLGMNLRKNLSPIEEGEDVSPRNGGIPELEGYDPENPMYTNPKNTSRRSGRQNKRSSDGSEVIDLTKMASPKSPTTQDGVKGGVFSFDDIMDVAASKLAGNNDGDRYAVDGDTSPRKATTPKASGGQDPLASRQVNSMERAGRSSPSDGNNLAIKISPQSSFEVYEHPEGDIVMWSEKPIQEKTASNPKEFNGNFADGLFDLLSTDESVSRGRKKVPFLADNQDASMDETQESTDDVEEANACMFDLTLGACGKDKVPFKQSIQNGLNKISTQVAGRHGMPAGTMSDDDSEEEGKINPNLGVMCGAVPLYFMYQVQNKDKSTSREARTDPSETKSSEYINIQEDRATRGAEESIPESSRQQVTAKQDEERSSVDETNSNEFEISLRQNNVPATSNILLDRDDAYWDTLSTIASTKDKSSGSIAKVEASQDSKPGPIPVEITMKNKPPPSSSPDQNESPFSEILGKLSNLIMEDDNKSTESLSKQVTPVSTEQRSQPKKSKEALSSPENHIEGTKSDNMNLTPGKESHVNAAKGRSPKDDEGSEDSSDLLLAVTRSDGNDEAKTGSLDKAPLSPSNGWQVRGMSKPFRITQDTLQEATSALRSYLPKTPESNDPNLPAYSSLNVHSKGEGIFSFLTKPDPKPEPLAASMSNNAFANPWRSSTRSVSWGVEEIYEATSPTSTSGIDAPQGSNDKTVVGAAASKAGVQPKLLSPTSLGTQSQSGTSSSQLSPEDEQELISRTLMLSKQLLSSMAIQQELGGADDAFVKSLMSFGTEDGKLSQTSPAAKSAASTDVSHSDDSDRNRPPSPALWQFFQSESGKVKPRTPTSIRQLGPAPPSKGGVPTESRVSEDPPQELESIQPSASGRSEDSPIDVEALFSKYDNMATQLIGENAKLQDKALHGTNDENTTVSSTSPKMMSRLDQLRAHRAEALAKLNGSPDRQFGNRVPLDANQVKRDRVGAYSQRTTVNPRAFDVVYGASPKSATRPALSEDDLDTASGMSASSTPSMKARELRRQLDEAIQASRSIKESQEQLGSELENFKSRFYRKNDALEDQAVRAIGGL